MGDIRNKNKEKLGIGGIQRQSNKDTNKQKRTTKDKQLNNP